MIYCRAGLLSRDKYINRVPFVPHVVKRGTNHEDVILQKDGDIHRLDLNLKPLRSIIKGNSPDRNTHSDNEEINIKVHIGKNASYTVKNASDPIHIYQHQNTVPNLFLEINRWKNISIYNATHFCIDDRNLLKSNIIAERQRTSPFNSTMVLLYQHEPGGYALRDCLIRAAYEKDLQINKLPLNALYRNEWEKLPTKQKNSFQVLFGGLSFGACEGIQHSCSYSTFVTHPIDRILQVYATCKKNLTKSMCHLNHLDMLNTTIHEFIHREGNNLFQKLLYYSRHCKLLGDDELCIHDKKAFFLLSSKEKTAYLENVLDNLSKWFRTVGLVQHWRQSIDLIDFTYGLNFSRCFGTVYREMLPAPKHNMNFKRTRDLYSFVQSKLLIDGKPYKEVREELTNNSDIIKFLHPDLSIYNRLEEIFKEQMLVYRKAKHILSSKYVSGQAGVNTGTSQYNHPGAGHINTSATMLKLTHSVKAHRRHDGYVKHEGKEKPELDIHKGKHKAHHGNKKLKKVKNNGPSKS